MVRFRIRYFFLLAVIFMLSCKPAAPEIETLVNGELNWITLEEAQSIKNKDGKLFLVDVYTDWCGWCKVMDKKTFTNEEVKSYLGDNFYVVKFNAEQKEPLNFKGIEYVWRSSGRRGINTYAIELLNGRLSYPSLVFMNQKLEKLSVVPGYKTPDQLLSLLKGIKPESNS